MSAAMGVAERLLALETAVAELRGQMEGRQTAEGGSRAGVEKEKALADGAGVAPGPEQLAQALGNTRLAAALVRAGYTSPAAVAAATDESLLAVDGVAEKALPLIRQRLR